MSAGTRALRVPWGAVMVAGALVAAPGAASADPPPRSGRLLPGTSTDYPYDAKDVGKPRRAWVGRAFVHDKAQERATQGAPLPLLVFLHGLNKDLIPHRWMGGGNEGDVRKIVSGLIESGAVPPLVVAGPGSVVKEAVSHGASFAELDVDHFIERTEAALAAAGGPGASGVRIDRGRVVVVGHSGAGCSAQGGVVAAARARRPVLGVASIDTCMGAGLAQALAAAPATTHVVVTWQTASWKRPFGLFATTFDRGVAAAPPAAGVLRALDPLPALPRAHDATVAQTLERWLPRMLVPAQAAPP